MKLKKIITYILLGLIMFISIPTIFFGLRILFDLSNPLRQPIEQIRVDLLEITPLGSSIEEVRRVIQNNEEWRWSGHIATVGFPTGPRSDDPHIGVRSIRVGLGGYANIFSTGVVAWWGFDENDNLIDIRVQKNIFGW